MTHEQVSRMLAVLGAAYRVHVSPETIAVYAAALRSEDADVMDSAVGECIRHAEFFPTVAVLLTYAPAAVPKPDVCADCGGAVVVGRVGVTPYCHDHFRDACNDARSALVRVPPGAAAGGAL